MWPAHLATWEDEQALKLIFPAAPASGQAGSQGGRNVTMPPVLESVTEGGTDDGEAATGGELTQEAIQSTRTKRNVQPNNRYFGPSWTMP